MKRAWMLLLVLVAVAGFLSPNSVLATPITSSGDLALSGANVINFESETMATYTSLAINGVTFTADVNFIIDDDISNYYGDGSYGAYDQYLSNGTYAAPGFFELTIDFSNPTSAFGFNWAGAEEAAVWNLKAYDSSDNLLDTYLLPNTQSTPAFVGIAATNISYATLINSSSSGGWVGGPFDLIVIDNFTYQSSTGPTPVPEPATMLLLGFGLVGLAGLRKKVRKN